MKLEEFLEGIVDALSSTQDEEKEVFNPSDYDIAIYSGYGARCEILSIYLDEGNKYLCIDIEKEEHD